MDRVSRLASNSVLLVLIVTPSGHNLSHHSMFMDNIHQLIHHRKLKPIGKWIYIKNITVFKLKDRFRVSEFGKLEGVGHAAAHPWE
jgi:hypothetical protein